MDETIGTNLKYYRKRLGFTQKKLFEISGVSESYISQIETGFYNNMTICYLCDLCKALNITPNDLIPERYYK